jgi:hypothetical protein
MTFFVAFLHMIEVKRGRVTRETLLAPSSCPGVHGLCLCFRSSQVPWNYVQNLCARASFLEQKKVDWTWVGTWPDGQLTASSCELRHEHEQLPASLWEELKAWRLRSCGAAQAEKEETALPTAGRQQKEHHRVNTWRPEAPETTVGCCGGCWEPTACQVLVKVGWDALKSSSAPSCHLGGAAVYLQYMCPHPLACLSYL